MQRQTKALSKKAHFAWMTIVGMIIAGSFSIGLTDVSGNKNTDSMFQDNTPLIVHNANTSKLVSDELTELFESFDANHDGRLQFGEAKDFFYWVERNIEYRSDDESTLRIVPGIESTGGDGRAGKDYRQTPSETFEERAGDCEDMATLAVAFFNNFGIEAYVVGVNAKQPSELDHAVAIVRMEDFQDESMNYKELLAYSISKGITDVYGNSISSGTYLLIDNAYSDTFGYLSDGLEPDTFKVYCFIPLEKGYGKEWSMVVSRCLSMN